MRGVKNLTWKRGKWDDVVCCQSQRRVLKWNHWNIEICFYTSNSCYDVLMCQPSVMHIKWNNFSQVLQMYKDVVHRRTKDSPDVAVCGFILCTYCLHLGKKREMCFLLMSMCGRITLCQITTSATSRHCSWQSVTSSLSQWKGDFRLLHTVIIYSMKALDWCLRMNLPINHTWPAPPGTTFMYMLRHCINKKHTSVIFTQIERMYMSVSLYITPLHSPNVLLKASAAVNSICHSKVR